MPHPSWTAAVRLSLVSFNVKAYTAIEAEKAHVALNQLHAECLSRIRYKKVCEVHGEVDKSEIVMGYQYAPDAYVVIDPAELNFLRTEADKSVTIDKFVSPDEIDAIYFSGQTYYLVPDRQGAKPYAVMQKAMQEQNLCALATAVISNREQLVCLRPAGRLLTASALHYAASIRQPEMFESELPEAEVTAQELKLAKTLIGSTVAKSADLDEYRNVYYDKLSELVQAKIAGEELTPHKAERALPVFNFMEALKASLKKKTTKRSTTRKLAPSARTRAKPRRRKSG